MRKVKHVRHWLNAHRRQLYIWVPGTLVVLLLLAQLAYPSGRLLPWQTIDGVALGGMQKKDAADTLDKKYAARTLQLYFGDANKPQYTPAPAEFGLVAKNAERLEQMSYPWYLRIVPTSLVWAHKMVEPGQPDYNKNTKKLSEFLKEELGGSCQVAPINATAKVDGAKIKVLNEEPGGTCKESDVRKALGGAKPRLNESSSVRVSMVPIAAAVREEDVRPVVDTVNVQLSSDVVFAYDATNQQVPAQEIRKWLTFTSVDGKFEIGFDTKKADAYLNPNLAEKIARPAGISRVKTHDFVEVSREDGAVGRVLDTNKTLVNLRYYLIAEAQNVPVGDRVVEPKVEYTRTYSNTDTGLSALMKNYAESHPGIYGVSLIELDGKRRRAAWNDTQKFTTASTYKLYVAYSALKRVESGEYKWSDQISAGRNLEKCFDDMIVKSDNACAEALVAKIGYRALTVDAQSIVSGNTTFLDTESYKTTAGDLSTFMASLATGQMALHEGSQARLTDALKRNVYRQGIPSGVSGDVADKVGFLDGFLHDAAIVYSPSGTYALSVMTDGSSWAAIAELTREIEKLRQ